MPRAFSLDLRERVLAASREDQLSHRAIAARFRVGESTVRGWLRRVRTTGTLAAKPHAGGSRPKIDAAGATILAALIEEKQERTLAELAAGYREQTGVGISLSAVCRACQRLDLRRKKKELGARRADA